MPAGQGELMVGKGSAARLRCESVGSAVPSRPSLPVPFPGPGFILQSKERQGVTWEFAQQADFSGTASPPGPQWSCGSDRA